MRPIKKIHKADFRPIADLSTYSPLPGPGLPQLDPFLLLNHHGPQVYPPRNSGMPFGPHPHRGMETVTFVVDGDIMHKDSGGHESTIVAGGVQYMTAGRGLIHAEVSSDTFKKEGGNLEILQLWLNLPARYKMTDPQYIGLPKEEIPTVALPNGQGSVALVAGDWQGQPGAFRTPTNISLQTTRLHTSGQLSLTIPASRTILFYVIQGKVTVNQMSVPTLHLVEFGYAEGTIEVQAEADSLILLGHAEPFREPVVAQGPFVMNTEQEIQEAYRDYRMGKFGSWHE